VAKVALVIEVMFETKDKPAATAALARIPGELKFAIEESASGHALTGVVPGSTRIQIVKQAIQ
jgi:hypothetical protein